MKRSEMTVLTGKITAKLLLVVAAGLLAVAVAASVGAGLTSCKNPAGPGGNENENEQGSWTTTWVDTGNTQWRDKAGDPTKEVLWKEQKEIVTGTGAATGTIQWVQATPYQEQAKTVNNTLPAVSGTNVDVIGVIKLRNGGMAEIHNSLTADEASNVVDSLFPQYAAQADALKTVFAGATADNSALTAKFTALKNAEEAIRTAGSGKTITQRLRACV